MFQSLKNVCLQNNNKKPKTKRKPAIQQNILQNSQFCLHYEVFEAEDKTFNKTFPTILHLQIFFHNKNY